VDRDNERAQVFIRQVLHLVDEDRDGGVGGLRGLRDDEKKLGEVALETPGRQRRIFDAELHLADFDLEGAAEALERAERLGGEGLGFLDRAEPVEHEAERRHEHGREALVFGRLELDGAIALLLGHPAIS